MTWAEFRIRLHGFRREQERELMQFRELTWITYISPHLDPKKMKKSIDQFWPIKKGRKKVSEEMIERMKKVTAEYLAKKKENG